MFHNRLASFTCCVLTKVLLFLIGILLFLRFFKNIYKHIFQMNLSVQAQELMKNEELAKKVREITEDTEKFLADLQKKNKKYEDGWPEDRWEEEMEKHPLFMSKACEDKEVPPLVAAFQSLKYDPEYNDPTELAQAHKEDGNEQFKLKKYKYAVVAYSEGLKMKSEDTELNATLYCNRAAAYYHMGNYRKSLEDATAAKALKPNYVKSIYRGALCCFQMDKYDDCIFWCDEGLKLNDKNKTLFDLKKTAEKQIEQREAEKAEQSWLDEITKAVRDRKINITKDALTPKSAACNYNGVSAKVYMTDDGQIVWPVVFMYPQYHISDFIPNFNENSCFYDYFCELFNDHPDWDIKKEYTPKNLKVYFCDKEECIVPVQNLMTPLKTIMRHKRFQVTGGMLNFFVTCSEFDEIYRSQNSLAER